ncbi:MAG: Calx-beta domain-containing protein, partial [Planktothrix sp.]
LTPSITFDANNWNQFQTVNVTGVDDSERDGDRNFTIQTNISSEDVQYSELDVEEIAVKNIDDETENVLITQSNGSTEISEDGTIDSFEVVLTGFPIDDVVVNITPDSQVDLGNGIGQPITLNFTPENASTPQIVTVEAVDDDDVEGEHLSKISYIANSNDPLYAGLGGEINVDITDNDNPTVSLKSVGNGSEQSLIPGVFQLALDHPASSQGLTVNYTVSGAATAGTDYTIVGLNPVTTSGSVYIAPGETGVNISVTPIQDLITELGGETVTIELEMGTGYNIGTVDPQNVIITDDDVAGVRVLETGNGTQVVEQNVTPVDSNKTDRYQISLTSSPGVGETVAITPNFNNTNLQLLDSNQNPITEITFDATNWNQSQVITVVGLDDSQAGTLEQIITHSSSSSDATSPYNSGLEIDGKPLPEVTVEITEPTYDSGEIADGLALLFERIAE